MEYDYLVCPKCWDKLIEVKGKEDLERKCPKCGTPFGLALCGKKIDDSIYQIIILEYRAELDDMRISDIRNKLRDVHLDADNLVKAIRDGKQGDIIYEGDSFHTYLFIKVFSEYKPWIEFEIVPEFPYKIMEYDYLVCPKCWDKLIEVKEKEDWKRKCPKCGTRFGLALRGKKIDDSIYQIILLEYWAELDDMRISDIRNKLRDVHLDADNLVKAVRDGKQGDIIYEGDSFHTYLFTKVFSGYEPWIQFEIVPEFPYKISEPDIFFCPECGEETDSRTEPFDDIKGWFIDGLFCRHCNKWTLGPIAIRDTTIYKLVFPYKKIKCMTDGSIKRGIMNRLEKVPDKKIEENQMIVHTNSERIIEIASCLKSLDLAYEIEPPFPHKIE